MYENEILELLKKYYKESIFVTDGNGTIVYINDVGAERIGSDVEYSLGKNVNELMAEGLYTQSTSLQAIRTKKEAVAPISEKEDEISYSRSVPVFDENGEVRFVVTTNMNMAQNEEWEEIMRRQKVEQEKLERERDFMRLKDQRVIIGDSPVMQTVLGHIDAIAPTDSNVVLQGESGTGKDMIAMLIHEKSDRSKHPYISINCAAMPENLLESELFGYEGGAFTGAKAEGKIGLFEATSGGTLFLDEIGDMGLALQSKLLRVLENHEVRRVGGIKTVPVDVRVICATNKDLKQMVEEKTFREDLYYRLSVFEVDLPRLAERKEDIIPIANMFLDELNLKYGKKKSLSQVTVDTMLDYEWPGNIRELRNVVERIFVVSRGDELVFTPVPTARYGDEEDTAVKSGLDYSSFESLKSYTEAMELKFIEAAIAECGGSMTKAANRLGIHRSVLYRKLNREK